MTNKIIETRTGVRIEVAGLCEVEGCLAPSSHVATGFVALCCYHYGPHWADKAKGCYPVYGGEA